ncbi:NAD(P)/FAD-dependent oxidoreductase [Proteinivorax hydrogeniformans]|uniref:NAD(P)/FAD-dependent oxidoreductase n=2 Tax=Proteinivorax hydrogeniformans TaxID=1826727 RepID=A0AAU8HXB0_9FIRM
MRRLMMRDVKSVIVVGGGASGMIAAISAARQGAKVVILERLNRIGKKLLATGNGRCNLTNTNMDISFFHGTDPKFALGALHSFDYKQTIDFFDFLGITPKVEGEGKVYPYSLQSSSVLDVLRYEIAALNIMEKCDTEVLDIVPTRPGFIVKTKSGQLKGDSVIIATGGKASPQLGSNGSGYVLAEKLGHRLTEIYPSLVQLKLYEKYVKQMKGVKFEGKVSVGVKDKALRVECGEILFTDYGISGPPILQVSRTAIEQISKGKSPWVEVDVFPQYSKKELQELISTRLAYSGTKPLDFSFVGLINKNMIPVVLQCANIKDIKVLAYEVTEQQIQKIVEVLKNWRMSVKDFNSWDQAQTTAGGVDVRDVSPKTMESKIVKGLYFSGELLDIDGDCGGFNLQWAWSSGFIAGENAAKE